MSRIGIVGAGIGGLQLGLFLRACGISATIYTDRTPRQVREGRLRNVVLRNGPTRARERSLGVDFWDASAPDVGSLSVTVLGPKPIAFTGTLEPPSQLVDMRIYCARLLEEFALRGGEVAVRHLSQADLVELSAAHDLLVVACGRDSLASLFASVPEHSPYTRPQRTAVFALFRGVRYPQPIGFSVFVSRGHGEILVFPVHSFEPDVTGIAVEVAAGGAFESLPPIRYDLNPRGFEAAFLDILREHAPAVCERVDPTRFGVARPQDAGSAAITPTVRREYAHLANGKPIIALGDAHIVMDPITGQGANKASHGAFELGAAIRDARSFDDEFCAAVEARVCAYAVPVSDSCNARLVAPPPHVARLLGAAGQHQVLADLYGSGFNHPDLYWKILTSEERTDAVLKLFTESPTPPAPDLPSLARMWADV
jgi:2-polyprenyl-6-methoxyphenol hydroxylase-like FAD-dependent oxidoreductase